MQIMHFILDKILTYHTPFHQCYSWWREWLYDMFANQYDELYSCVAYDSRELASLKNDINNRLCSQAYNQNSKVNFGDVNDAVQSLNEVNVTDLAAWCLIM